MKVISANDLLLIPELSHMTIFDIINPANDHIVNPFLGVMGFDLDYALEYMACQHRTLANKVVVGYTIAGQINISREHMLSPWCTTQERLIGNGYTDHSLARELMEMSGTSVSYDTIHSLDDNQNREIQGILDNYMDVEESNRITNEIKILDELLFAVRGDQRLSSGAYKLAEDYHKEEILPRPRKKKVKKVKEVSN